MTDSLHPVFPAPIIQHNDIQIVRLAGFLDRYLLTELNDPSIIIGEDYYHTKGSSLNNCHILLVFWAVFCVARLVTYLGMLPPERLEYTYFMTNPNGL